MSQFLRKVAKPAELRHAHPAFTRFMAEHPLISRFMVEHPRMSRFLLNVAHHIPVLDHYVPIAPHISAEFAFRAKPRPRRPKFWS